MSKEEVMQVKDDSDLLEIMLEDNKSAPSLFQPTNLWKRYENMFLPELQSLGLHDFRRRKNSIVSSFGATDETRASIFIKILYKGRGSTKRRVLHFILRNMLKNKKINSLISYIAKGYSGISQNDLDLLSFEYAKSYGIQHGSKPINEFGGSLIGNPDNIFYIEDKIYTIDLLNYYIKYAHCSKFIDFNSINSIAEIGSGSGKQTEVMKRLYPDINFYIFDIPPQIYVAEQYLSALFPDSVVSYRETRKLKQIPKNEKGKIYIFEPQHLAQIQNLKYDFFFNASSFQEMEPEVVTNYLKYVNEQTEKYVFISGSTEGKELAPKPGKHGVLKPTTLEHYKNGLKDFELTNISKRVKVPDPTKVKTGAFMFWNKKSIMN